MFEQDNNDDDWLDAEDSKKCNQDGKEVMTAQAPKLQFLYIQVQKPHLSCKNFENFPHQNLHDLFPTAIATAIAKRQMVIAKKSF